MRRKATAIPRSMRKKKCRTGRHVGEICLLASQGKYPVTNHGVLNKKRVRAAIAYGSKNRVIKKLKKNGLCTVARKLDISTRFCR